MLEQNISTVNNDVKTLVKDAQALFTAATALTGEKAEELRGRGMRALAGVVCGKFCVGISTAIAYAGPFSECPMRLKCRRPTSPTARHATCMCSICRWTRRHPNYKRCLHSTVT